MHYDSIYQIQQSYPQLYTIQLMSNNTKNNSTFIYSVYNKKSTMCFTQLKHLTVRRRRSMLFRAAECCC